MFDLVAEKVNVQIYYESFCPDSMRLYDQVPPVVEKLGASIHLLTYPYGKANMTNENGNIVVKCQHGEDECYGNKMQACAIDDLKYNMSAYVPFNACMMPKYSDDVAVDECGKSENIDLETIKTCAKGKKGNDLLVYYGNETQKVSFSFIPHVLINGKLKPKSQDLMPAVCQAFEHPPDACKESSLLLETS